MEIEGQLSSLLAALEPPTPSLTLIEVSAGTRLIGPPLGGVAALVVMAGTMHVSDGDGEYMVRPGRVMLLPPGRRAAIAAAPGTALHEVSGQASLVRRGRWLVADATRGRTPDLVVAGTRIAGGDAIARVVVQSIAGCAIGRPIFQLLRAELARGGAGHPALAVSLMSAVVVQALRRALAAADGGAGAAVNDTGIGRAVATMRAHPGEPHSVGALAGVAGMSRSTFLRHFARVMRTPPMAYLQHVRLEEARAMLRTTALPIKTVAARTGFASRSHFSRLFRARYGVDPSHFRLDHG